MNQIFRRAGAVFKFLTVGVWSLVNLVACSSQFSGAMYTSAPGQTPLGEQRAAAEMSPCQDAYRAARIVFVIDNTESNGAKPGVIGFDQKGTDEVKSFSNRPRLLDAPEMKIFAQQDRYTHRQLAVYQSIVRLRQAAVAARSKNPDFEGIDVGVAHFPASAKDLSNAVFHHGEKTGLPFPMTELSSINGNEEWNRKIWDMLSFTHESAGITPYITAYNAAKELLLSPRNRKSKDNRPMFMMFITDGLPTDSKPQDIIAARRELGKETTVKLLSIYRQKEDDLEQNAAAKETLKKLYTEHKFGRDFSDFEDYWNAMKKIPNSKEVSDSYTQINTARVSDSLLSHLEQILSCSTK